MSGLPVLYVLRVSCAIHFGTCNIFVDFAVLFSFCAWGFCLFAQRVWLHGPYFYAIWLRADIWVFSFDIDLNSCESPGVGLQFLIKLTFCTYLPYGALFGTPLVLNIVFIWRLKVCFVVGCMLPTLKTDPFCMKKKKVIKLGILVAFSVSSES